MRLFLNQTLAIGEDITLQNEEYNYIARVLRSRESDPVILFNGEGGEYHGNIVEIAKRHLTVRLKKFNPINRTSRIQIHLLQSLAKGEKMELVLQKSTELGITSITPLATERSVMHLKKDQTEKRLDRWNNIITSACEQCGLNIPPKLHEPHSLDSWIQNVLPTINTTIITLAPTAEHSLGSFLKSFQLLRLPDQLSGQENTSENSQLPHSFTIVIGPEGGLTKEEIIQLQNASAQSVSLGARILRTETAALTVISTLQGVIGDWSTETDLFLEN